MTGHTTVVVRTAYARHRGELRPLARSNIRRLLPIFLCGCQVAISPGSTPLELGLAEVEQVSADSHGAPVERSQRLELVGALVAHDNATLIACEAWGTLRRWNLHTGQELAPVELGHNLEACAPMQGHKAALTWGAGALRQVDLLRGTSRVLDEAPGLQGVVTQAGPLVVGTYFSGQETRGHVRWTNVRSGERGAYWLEVPVYGVGWVSDGLVLPSVALTEPVSRPALTAPLQRIDPHSHVLSEWPPSIERVEKGIAVALMAQPFDGSLLATASNDGELSVWTADGTHVASWRCADGPLSSTFLGFTPDGSRVVVHDPLRDQVCVRHLPSGKMEHLRLAPSIHQRTLAMSPDSAGVVLVDMLGNFERVPFFP